MIAAIGSLLLVCTLCVGGVVVSLLGGLAESPPTAILGCGNGALVDPNGPLPSLSELTEDQMRIAAIIVKVGQDLAVPPRGWVIAVATAMQESRLSNHPHLGAATTTTRSALFQQRPSQGWGTAEQLADPAYQAGKFYDKLLTVAGWQTLPLTDAAQTGPAQRLPRRLRQARAAGRPDGRRAHRRRRRGRPAATGPALRGGQRDRRVRLDPPGPRRTRVRVPHAPPGPATTASTLGRPRARRSAPRPPAVVLTARCNAHSRRRCRTAATATARIWPGLRLVRRHPARRRASSPATATWRPGPTSRPASTSARASSSA